MANHVPREVRNGWPQKYVFPATAGTREFNWDGEGVLQVSNKGPAVVTLKFRHGPSDAWKDYSESTVANAGEFFLTSCMPTSPDYQLGIHTSGAAEVLVGKFRGALDPGVSAGGGGGGLASSLDSGLTDAFGRSRVSAPSTLFDSKQLHDDLPLIWDEEDSGGGETSVHDPNTASTTIGVTADTEYVVRQSKTRANYAPGKSQLIFTTFVLGAGTANVTKRVGYFNSSTVAPYTANIDGVYLEQDGTDLNIVLNNNGTPTSVAQASWNIDTMDGNGNSLVNIDVTKAQILVIDYEWLGVGRVRVGFVVDGAIYYAHAFNNANTVTGVYMKSPNHSCRYEIRSSGGSDTLETICSSVISEGGDSPLGVPIWISTEGSHLDADVENTLYALVGIRLKSTHLDAQVSLLQKTVAVLTGTDDIEWQLLLNPSVADTFTYNPIPNTALEYALGATANTVTLGHLLDGGFIRSGNAVSGAGESRDALSDALRLGASIAGVADTIVLCVRPINGATTVDVEGGLQVRQLV